MGLRLFLATALAVLVISGAQFARAEPGDDLTIFVLTFGPGDHPFFKFGHNAILVQPKDDGGLVYNFGTFQFDSPALIPKFLRGRFKYWLSVSRMEDTYASYVSDNRTIEAQELDLTPAQKMGPVAEPARERAAREPGVPLRLLPGQLFDPRTRRHRSRGGRPGSAGGRTAGGHDLPSRRASHDGGFLP